MVASSSATDRTKATVSTEMDDVMEHVRAIREDFAALAASTGKLAAGQAKTQARRVGTLAGDAAEKAAGYRDLVADKVRAHPLAAIGIAALAGLIVSWDAASLRRTRLGPLRAPCAG